MKEIENYILGAWRNSNF